MSYETITLQTDPRGVCRLALARADKHNALSATMIAELHEAITALGQDPAVRVIVLEAKGKSFCAGGDLAWMRDQMAADGASRMREAGKLAAMLNSLNLCPKPLIAKVQGNAFGGGIGIISVCDVAIGVAGARFALTETRLGLIPATIGPYVIARMGEGKARRVFMSGRVFDAAEAMALDLLAKVVPEAALEAAIEAEVTPYLACAPQAVAAAKALARSLGPVIDPQVIGATALALKQVWEGDEAPEGIAAFFAKTKPSWQQ